MAGLGPAIHVFADGMKERRGWIGCRHSGKLKGLVGLVGAFKPIANNAKGMVEGDLGVQ